MSIKYQPGWNTEIKKYAEKYGPYSAFLTSFDENSINAALHDATGHFNDVWCRNFLEIAMDPHSPKTVTIEQGAHQVEEERQGGFCLHFTGRDDYGYAFHFYIQQLPNAALRITKMTYMENQQLKTTVRT